MSRPRGTGTSSLEADMLPRILEPEHARQLFHQSLHAALNLPEARQLVEACGGRPEFVFASSDRHWTICGRWPNR